MRINCTNGFVALAIILGAVYTPQLYSQVVAFGAQQGPAPVTILGAYRLLGQASSRQGSFSEKPPDLWRAEFNPTLAIYGIPLTASLLLSSEQQGFQQDISAFSITLDPDAIQRIVRERAYNALESYARSEAGWMLDDYEGVKDSLEQYDPARLKELEHMRELSKMRDVSMGGIDGYEDVLNEMGLMSDVESVMSSLPTIGVGTVFPSFSPITLNGARVSGAYGEWNPGKVFYIAAVGGRTQKPLTRVDNIRVDTTVFTTLDNSDYGRLMYGGRIGVGNRDGDHVILTGMYATDDASSLALPDSGIVLTPKTNYLSSLDLRVEPIKGIWSLEAEVASSITINDQNAPSIIGDGIPPFLLELIDSSSSAYVDWAASASTIINLLPTNTRITASFRRIGAGYTAFGVPNLRTDYLRYDVRVNQRFWKRQITVGAFFRRDRDNLIPIKRATSSLQSLGVNLGLNIRTWPYLRLSYSPYVQESDATDTLLQYQNNTVLWSIAGGHSYRIGSLSANTNLTFSRQDAETKENLYDYAVSSISGQQTIGFTFPLSLTAGLGYISQSSAQDLDTDILTVDFSGYYSLNEMFSTSGGLTLAFDNTFGDRTGYFLSVLARLGDYADIDLRVERNLFSEQAVPALLGGSYVENIFRVTISKSW